MKKKKNGDSDTNKNIHIGMDFDIAKMSHAYKEKWEKSSNERNGCVKSRENKNILEEEKLQLLGNTESEHHQTNRDKKIRKEYLRKSRKIKLCSRNLIKGIHTRTVPFARYSEQLLKWTRKEVKQLDQRTRKLMMHKALHLCDDLNRLYVLRTKRERRIASIENCVDASIHRVVKYI